MDPTIIRITVRGLLGRRRFLLLPPLPLLVVGLAALTSGYDVEPVDWGPPVLAGLGMAVVLPVVALVVGTGVLGSEIDDGTVLHILTKPLPRSTIVLSKLLVAVSVTAVTVAVPLFVAGVLADSVRLGLALVVAVVVGSLAYSALFVALSLVTRRPVLLGLVYILVLEGLLGGFAPRTRVLSIQQYCLTLVDEIAPTDLIEGHLSIGLSVLMSALFTVGFGWLAVDRLRSFRVAGETS
jgi:ABC-2 type transport system permease protein